MSAPKITFASTFRPDFAAGLLEITDTATREVIVQPGAVLEPTLEFVYRQPTSAANYSGIVPGVISESVDEYGVITYDKNDAWYCSGASEPLVTTTPAPGIKLFTTELLSVLLTDYIYRHTDYKLYIATTFPSENNSDVQYTVTLNFGQSTSVVQVRRRDCTFVPFPSILDTEMVYLACIPIHIPVESCLLNITVTAVEGAPDHAPLLVHGVYLQPDWLLYTSDNTVQGRYYYSYQPLWLHHTDIAHPVQLIGPSGEIIPETEYRVQYSSSPYTDIPRYGLARLWSNDVPVQHSAICISASDSLLEAYEGQPLKLRYNALKPALQNEFEELISWQPNVVLPWYIAYARTKPWEGIATAGSGYILRTQRPAIRNIVYPTVIEADVYSFPTSLGNMFYSTPECYLQPRYRGSELVKTSWERPVLYDDNTIKIFSGLAEKRTPSNKIVTLFDRDPDEGTPLPIGWNARRYSDEFGSVLVSVNDVALANETVIGIDSYNGYVICGENLSGKDVWVSYLRDYSWWIFDRPYIQSYGNIPVDEIRIRLLPSFCRLFKVTTGNWYWNEDNRYMDVPLDYLTGIGTDDYVTYFTEVVPVIYLYRVDGTIITAVVESAELKDQDVEADPPVYQSCIRFTLEANPEIEETYDIISIGCAWDDYKLMYSVDGGATYYTASNMFGSGSDPVAPPSGPALDATHPYVDDAISLGLIQHLQDAPTDYKVESITVAGGGLLPDKYYRAQTLQQLYPLHENFADIAYWKDNKYQADATLIGSIRKDWYDDFVAALVTTTGKTAAEARDYTQDLFKRTISKYASYGAYVDLTIVPWYTSLANFGMGVSVDSDTVLPATDPSISSYTVVDSLVNHGDLWGFNNEDVS